MKSSGIFDKGFWKKKLTQAGDAVADLLRPQPQLAPVRVKAKRDNRRR